MKKIKAKKLLVTTFILFVFLFGGVFSNFAGYSSVYAKGATSHSSGGSFKSGSFSSPKSSSGTSSGTYKSGSFSNSKSSSGSTGTNTSTYSGSTKRSFIPVPFFIPFGHSYYGYASPIGSMVELVIFIILIIFIIRLFKKYKRRR